MEEMNALKFCVLMMFVPGKCCAIDAFFSPAKSMLLCQRFSHDLSWFQSRLVRFKTRFASEPEVLPMDTSFKLTASWGAR